MKINGGGQRIEESHPLNTFELHPRAKPTRVFIVIYTCAIVALLYYHLSHNIHRPIHLFIPLLLSDLVLAFMWVASQSFRWRPIRRKVYPENLSKQVNDEDLPRLDAFICTADPYKEPPIDVVNTVVSVMAFDYPTEKISVYVSDDGGSQMSLFAMMEASKFAKHWLPFVKRHHIKLRCPKAFFQGNYWGGVNQDEITANYSKQEWEKMKMVIRINEYIILYILYDEMKTRIEYAMERGYVEDNMIENEEKRKALKKWTTNGFSRQDHPTVIQVILESGKDTDVSGESLPNLIYLSREKRKDFHHNFKAGALNVLIRVSTIMTNAPVVLSLDCDMYCNDPQTPRKALCHLLDPIEGSKIAFVQFPQRYNGINQTDMYNNELKRPFHINAEGLDGLGCVNYTGTGTFVNRKAFYGGPSENNVPEFPDCGNFYQKSINTSSILEAAHSVAACSYEKGTNWGSSMGFRYGSLVEDFFTGYRLQCEGWRSVLCNPSNPAFLGDFPITLSDSLTQLKRWSVGLIQVFFSKYCPLTYGARKHSLLMGLGYGLYSLWPICSIPVVIYGLLPQLALLNNIYLFPKVSDRWTFGLYSFLFVASYAQDLVENLMYGGTFQKWWNEQRMWMIRGVTSFNFALVEFTLSQIGISAPGFSLTNKVIDDEQQKLYDQEIFGFGTESPFFVMLSTVALMNLVSFSWGIMKLVMRNGDLEEMFVQLFISGFVMVNAWPVYEAMVLRSDGGRMPTRITLISIFLTWALCYGAMLL